ncbi:MULTISPECIES: adenosylcobinamide-phosphate synthase CbiB [unclassified Pseudodesulfovibrio]|uniref:adenosylcobinamide-phosphate synthase CbiB n=1 Tax=unclassified Pseudodesulfovibrio TaxID=2661612 RepID=UPI000FEB961A|nr:MULTISPECIES: adenosylcobinamide-phosphate synthase CbiB [unclassified Pseudodesulfovibrio]MCJ2163887.1 adenosylcobinamide-phosphate synthase CbiB [Pseudodesulfovibrio sp. S3-i]RWU05867.1 cobalamin biosynthesis protein CobD [Pseudodesulfovibrio sp. S3]
MQSTILIFTIPVLAVILDGIFGDPKSLPHPVRLIGKGLDLYEASARRVGLDLRAAGWIAVFLFGAGAWALVALLMHIPYLGVIIGVYFAYAGLALGCLVREARKVTRLLDTGDLAGARHALSMLVSRDTKGLDANGIRRTLAETMSENLNDGFVAPLFYLALFGPGGLWAYKTVSTMDSMWGYRTKQYNDLGRGAAKTDDFLAYIPARITAYLLIFVGKRQKLAHEQARARFKADALKMESPNAGWPMAAAAWLMGGQMGGPTVYFGKIKDKPALGPKGKVWDKSMILSLMSLCQKTGSLAAWVLIPTLGLLQLMF